MGIRKRRHRVGALFVIVLSGAALASAQPDPAPPEFGGKYADLTPRQIELFDDLLRRFNELTGEALDPETTYDLARLSKRTTYEAATHALANSTLTDANGESVGSALDLVEHLEAIQGKVESGRSDEQFRLYVRLVPGAVDRLERATEFFRDNDNKRYHRGYPLSFRQEGRVPSIQFSITRDGGRADIDVDYRAATFPAALFNGHLTAANSDVRAGDNIDVHSSRWEGFVNWWRGLFSFALSVSTRDAYEDELTSKQTIPETPRRGNERIDVAVHDFLTAWFVEADPVVAASYVSRRADECTALDSGDAASFDYGLARYALVQSMKEDIDELGAVERLEDVLTGVRLDRPGIRVVQQEHHGQFVLYGVTNDRAARFDCANRATVGRLAEPRRVRMGASLEDFDYFASAFFVELPERGPYSLGLLWHKEQGFWKIVAYEVEVHGASERDLSVDVRPPTEIDDVPRVAGNAELIQAVDGFAEAWLVQKDIDRAMDYLAPSSLPCVNLRLATGEAPVVAPSAQRERIRAGLERTADHFGPVSRLEDVIGGVELWLPELREIVHARETAYSIFSVPDSRGEAARCEPGQPSPSVTQQRAPEAASTYGRYYVSAFRIQTVAGETVALLLGWTREGGEWRIYSFRLAAP